MFLNDWENSWHFGLMGAPMNDPAYLPFARLTLKELEDRSLPEELREIIEARKDAYFSAADIQGVPEDPRLR